MASRSGHVELIKFYISKGADVNYSSPRSRFSPLMHATLFNHVEVIKILLDYGADIEHEDDNGWRALHWAVNERNMEAIKALVELGNADINGGSEPAYAVAERESFESELQYLRSRLSLEMSFRYEILADRPIVADPFSRPANRYSNLAK